MVEQRPFKPKVVGSIPTAPTNLLSYQHVKRPLVFHSEHLFQLNAEQCAPSNHASTAESRGVDLKRRSHVGMPHLGLQNGDAFALGQLSRQAMPKRV